MLQRFDKTYLLKIKEGVRYRSKGVLNYVLVVKNKTHTLFFKNVPFPFIL